MSSHLSWLDTKKIPKGSFSEASQTIPAPTPVLLGLQSWWSYWWHLVHLPADKLMCAILLLQLEQDLQKTKTLILTFTGIIFYSSNVSSNKLATVAHA